MRIHEDNDFTPFRVLDAPIFTSEGFMIAFILIASVFLSRYSKRLRRFI